MDIWISALEISSYVVLGVFGVYGLEFSKRWLFGKLI